MNNDKIPVSLSELPEIDSADAFVFASKENTDGSSDSGKLAVSKIQEEAEKKKGYFNSLESLMVRWPNPQSGMTAYVGAPFPGTVHDVVSGAWHDTGETPPEDAVPLNDYTLNGGSTKTSQQLDEELNNKFSAIGKDTKNLFNRYNLTLGKYVAWSTASGVTGIADDNNSAMFIFRNIKPNIAYTLSGIYEIHTNAIAFCDKNENILGGISPVNNKNPITVTTPADCTVIKMSVYVNRTVNLDKYTDKLQLEEGKFATSYVPFISYNDLYRKEETNSKAEINQKLYGYDNTYLSVLKVISKEKPVILVNGYYNKDGTITNNNYYGCMRYDYNPNEILMYEGRLNGGTPAIARFFNENNTQIGFQHISGISSDIILEIIIPPSGTSWIGFSCNKTTGMNLWNIKEISSPNPVLNGKTWVTIGDSIDEAINTDGKVGTDPITEETMSHAYYIAKRNNMKHIRNSKSGGTLTYIPDRPSYLFCFSAEDDFSSTVHTYKNLPDKIDYLTIWFGINDYWKLGGNLSSENIGTINDAINTTFYGAWNIVLDYLINKYPNTKIGIVVTHKDVSADATVFKLFTDAIRAIALKYGVGCLDLMGATTPLWTRKDPNVNVKQSVIDLRVSKYLYDGTHPNKEGYVYLATLVENWLCSL